MSEEKKLDVGSKVFVLDYSQRVYDENRRLTYRGYFVEREVIGETSRSWLVGEGWRQIKVSKKTLEGIFTAEQVDEQVWIAESRSDLSRLVDSCRDYSKLKKIAEILEVE